VEGAAGEVGVAAGVAAGVALAVGATDVGVAQTPAVGGADEGMAWDPPQAATNETATSSDEVVSVRRIECLPSGSGASGSSDEVRQQPSDGMA
jgi:hypothetical protein